MSDQLGGFFQSYSEDDLKKAQQTSDQVREMAGMVEVPGKYLMKVKSVVSKKKDGGIFATPVTEISSNKGVLMLVLMLEVVDGTEAVEKGSILYHRITLLPKPGSPDEKMANTLRFMKPAVKALTGLEKIEISEAFFKEYLTIDYVTEPEVKLVRNHKMNETIYATVEEQFNEQQNKKECRIKFINKAKPTDSSYSIKAEPSDNENLAGETTVVDENKNDGEGIDLEADETLIQDASSESTVEDY